MGTECGCPKENGWPHQAVGLYPPESWWPRQIPADKPSGLPKGGSPGVHSPGRVAAEALPSAPDHTVSGRVA